jgi:hypothetical protein
MTPHEFIDAALEQLSRYAAALEYPPLHIACDMDRFVIVTAWTNTVPPSGSQPRGLDAQKVLLRDPV